MPKWITPEIVLAAKSGDSAALATVAHFFDSYIKKAATRPLYDEYGNKYDYVDEEIRRHIESQLFHHIVCNFDPDMVLRGDKLTDQ